MKTVFSAVQPSGSVTLGNYAGAIKNWIKLQNEYNCIFALADLHTITVRQDPKIFKDNVLNMYALFLACGIDTKKSLFFLQSHVRQHTELSWILNCYTQFGELSRMTQFKDKSQRHPENINAGLFTYPSLMAADILLYQADLVPVGDDQRQHLEITRNIAQRFNGIYGETFKIPEGFIPKTGARIMSLQEPNKKMSKSDDNSLSCVCITDSENEIMKKFKKAVTDSYTEVKFRNEMTGIDNLISIYCVITGKTTTEVESEFSGKGYGDFKKAVAEAVISEFKPIKEKFENYIKDKNYIEKCYKESAEKAKEIAEKTLKLVKEKIGFVL